MVSVPDTVNLQTVEPSGCNVFVFVPGETAKLTGVVPAGILTTATPFPPGTAVGLFLPPPPPAPTSS